MKILFCGSVVPEDVEYRVKDISAAGNRFQNNLIENMRTLGHEVHVISFLGMPMAEEERQSLLQGTEPFCTYVLPDGGKGRGRKQFMEAVKAQMSKMNMVICYNIVYAWFGLARMARRYEKKSVLVLADYSGPESYTRIDRKMYAILCQWQMRAFDKVVGLSRRTKRYLRDKQEFVVMQGGIDRKLYDVFSYRPREDATPIKLLYSGLLSPVTGVDLLLEAFDKIDNPKIELWISGKGDLMSMVEERAAKDSRIRYLGHLDYQEYIGYLQKADILLNPRNMRMPENQNNFPSKIMDYLAAGKCIVSTRFIGWEDYEGIIEFCEDTPEAIRESIRRMIKMGYDEASYRKCREKAEDFLWEKQIMETLL